MNDFDKAARYAAKMDPPGFLGWLLPRLDPALRFRGWLDTRRITFPGEPDRTCDTVAGLEDDAVPPRRWAVVVEFQSEIDPGMLGRLLDYLSRLYLERGRAYAVAAALVNLTGGPQSDALDMRLPGMEDFGLRLRAVVRTMRDESAADTLAGIASGQIARCMLPWIPLMQGGAEAAIMEAWKQTAEAEADGRLRGQYAGLALMFADLAGRKAEWKTALEGWNVQRSQVAEEWRAEGRVEGRRASLLEVLEARLQSPVPADLRASIEALTDPGELSRWIAAASRTASLEEFRAAVRA